MTDRTRPSMGMQLAPSFFVAFVLLICPLKALAHPLGNFTINHFARIEIAAGNVQLHTVVDMAEIPAFQELQKINGSGTASAEELRSYLDQVAGPWAANMSLLVDGVRVPLRVLTRNIGLQPGVGRLQTLRIEIDLTGEYSAVQSRREHSLRFEDSNFSDRIGWRELVVAPLSGITIFNSSAYGNGLSDELRSYPSGMLAAPLDERNLHLSFNLGPAPPGVRPLVFRNGRPTQVATRDRLAELIAAPNLTPGVALLGILLAMLLGAVHALSPGHGKTVVGAYLVGSRGTPRHAAFLGLTVTATHTAGVFALGLVTLLASKYVLPERLFPLLSLASGALVVAIGMSLSVQRLRKVLGPALPGHMHAHGGHIHGEEHEHGACGESHHGIDPALPHSHGGRPHAHLPPGADGSPVTWKGLLALGISGGILPCPSALVVLLAAISLHRVAYGLLLVLVFSLGLAGSLTAVGLLFVYARKLLPSSGKMRRLSEVLPIVSAFVITCAGLDICYEALVQAGINLASAAIVISRLSAASATPSFASMGALGVLGLGLVFGLKHATEADHIVAVSTIVSEHRKLGRAALVGALWGAGHTATLVVVGAMVLALRIAIPARVAHGLEFIVALMIIGLGAFAFRKALGARQNVHIHRHGRGAFAHTHLHFHDAGNGTPAADGSHSHSVVRIGIKPAIVGAVHGLAGSAALTLLVLTQIESPKLGLLYLAVFGMGSILGMLLVSGLVGLPFALTSRKLGALHYRVRMVAGLLSILFGVWYAYQTGFTGGL